MSNNDEQLTKRIDEADARIRRTEDAIISMELSMRNMADSMSKMQDGVAKVAEVVVLQEEHRKALERCFKKYDQLELRVRGIENQLPLLSLTSGWMQVWAERALLIGAGGGLWAFISNMMKAGA